MTNDIENLIDELCHGSNRRVEEIVTILDGSLSDIKCNFPTEDDIDSAYECQNIPKAEELIDLIKAWNARNRTGEERESSNMTINNLSRELKTTFKQISLVNSRG